jgi:hypothetical protein
MYFGSLIDCIISVRNLLAGQKKCNVSFLESCSKMLS